MCQMEDQALISKALAILRKWNPTWNPNYFMVDYSSAEIGAIKEQFPGNVVYICDFHRVPHCNDGQGQRRTIYDLLNRRCFWPTCSTWLMPLWKEGSRKVLTRWGNQDCIRTMYTSSPTWFSCSFRWARAFRKQQAINIVNTNNGTEAQVI